MQIPDRAGVMLLDGCPLFPRAMVPLFIFEPRYRSLLADALKGDRMMCLAMRQPGAGAERPNRLAGLGLIRVSVTHSNGTSHLMLQGLTRVRLGRAVQTKPYRVHRIEPAEEQTSETLVSDALVARLLDLVETR
ncbi:MAG: LON peptidase substrate-binding domain-containing protein, partial [Verrucomicrobiae bacterium]|nr:LON peptidase substrate-binding domain-containing protein [Verrucomicrobiae bacterium]